MKQLLFTHSWLIPVLSFLTASIAVSWIHPKLVSLARLKKIVDNPDARKLQRVPVPVLGGCAVFFGITIGVGCFSALCDTASLFVICATLSVMLYIGTMDDVMGLSPRLRFIVEILCVLLLIFIGGCSIDHFHGLWQIEAIPYWIAVPLTIFISVGIINSINLIDGVNGLSSGFCILACTVFGLFFQWVGDVTMSVLAFVCCGAIFPFFMHNVFGNTSRMFIGDGGTLVMGMVMSVFVMHVLCHDSACAGFAADGVGLIPFTMAVLAIPVFDTLRVMSARIVRGRSPFEADKTHLHHLFIGLGFSHSATAFCILSLNTFVVLVWALLCRVGASIEVQLYCVIALGILFTFVFYPFVRHLSKDSALYRTLRYIAVHSHIERKGFSLRLQRWLDKV